MRVLVTGGTGFIGSHLVEELLMRGHRVLCLVRERLGWLENLPVELYFGDLTRPKTLRGAVEGADCLYHLAGLVRAKDPREYFRANHLGTRNLLLACLEAEVPPARFVYVSSLAALGPSEDLRPLREEDTPRPISPYGLSKLKGEEEVLKRSGRLHVVVIRPPAVYGPRERDLYTYFRLAHRGFFPIVGFHERRLSLCYIDDLVQGLLLAGERDVPSGAIYHIAGEGAYSLREIREVFVEALGVRSVMVRLPKILFYTLAVFAEGWGRLTGRPPLFDRGKAHEMASSWIADISKAKRELGYAPRFPLQEGIKLTVHWYRKEGWL